MAEQDAIFVEAIGWFPLVFSGNGRAHDYLLSFPLRKKSEAKGRLALEYRHKK